MELTSIIAVLSLRRFIRTTHAWIGIADCFKKCHVLWTYTPLLYWVTTGDILLIAKMMTPIPLLKEAKIESRFEIRKHHSSRKLKPSLLSSWRMPLQVPAIPTTPTWSRIFAISLAVNVPLLARKKSSKAMSASFSFVNSVLLARLADILSQT